MWLAVVAAVVAFLFGLAVNLTASTAHAPYLGLLVVVMLESGARALRRNLDGLYTDRGYGYYLGSMIVVVFGLAWVGEQLSLGRVGNVSSLTLAVEVALSVRILGHVDAIREALVTTPEVPSPHESYGPPPPDQEPRKAGKVA